MTGRPGWGALVGALSAMAVDGMLFLPSVVRNDTEVSDPVVFMGLPILVLGAATSTVAGALLPAPTDTAPRHRWGRTPTVVVAVVAGAVAVVGFWWSTGFLMTGAGSS